MRLLAVFGLALLTGCAITWKGLPLVGINPDGYLLFEHPELVKTNGHQVLKHERLPAH